MTHFFDAYLVLQMFCRIIMIFFLEMIKIMMQKGSSHSSPITAVQRIGGMTYLSANRDVDIALVSPDKKPVGHNSR